MTDELTERQTAIMDSMTQEDRVVFYTFMAAIADIEPISLRDAVMDIAHALLLAHKHPHAGRAIRAAMRACRYETIEASIEKDLPEVDENAATSH